jgi:hypothetical protein
MRIDSIFNFDRMEIPPNFVRFAGKGGTEQILNLNYVKHVERFPHPRRAIIVIHWIGVDNALTLVDLEAEDFWGAFTKRQTATIAA